MYSTNPMLQQQLMQLDQKHAQEKANLMQSFYNQQYQVGTQVSSPQQQAPVQQPQHTQNVNWIPVNGVQGAKEHQAPANSTHWLMDSGDSVFYVKATDEFGTLKSFKGYRFEEIPEQELSGNSEQVDMSQYVSKSEFDELKAKLEQLTNNKKQYVKADKEAGKNG